MSIHMHLRSLPGSAEGLGLYLATTLAFGAPRPWRPMLMGLVGSELGVTRSALPASCLWPVTISANRRASFERGSSVVALLSSKPTVEPRASAAGGMVAVKAPLSDTVTFSVADTLATAGAGVRGGLVRSVALLVAERQRRDTTGRHGRAG